MNSPKIATSYSTTVVDFQKESQELYTIRDIIRWAASLFAANPLFYGHGTDNSWDEAVSLVLQTIQIDDAHYDEILDARLTQTERLILADLIQKRVLKRIPVPYLTHQARFAGLTFYVDERVLIPRSPLAELIEGQFFPWINPQEIESVLDLCTGSACIALAVNAYAAHPDVQIDAVDISSEALEVARINVEKHNAAENVRLIKSNLFEQLKGRQYNVIVSNPPYVDVDEMNALPAEFRHEPTLALAAGADGLDIVHQILREAPDYLTQGGLLIVEVGASAPALIRAYPYLPFVWLEFERGGDGVFVLRREDFLQSHMATS